MAVNPEVVITALGIVSPIGIGNTVFWDSLLAQRSGVRRLPLFERCVCPAPIGGSVEDFVPKQHVRARKNLKVMSRDIQLGFCAADMAWGDSGLAAGYDPQRSGVVFGADLIACELDELIGPYRSCVENGEFCYADWGRKALAEFYPLWMLKYLPNMPACHIGIAQDMRGPNNTLVLGEVSSLAAIIEATRAIQRGHVDAMLAGGAGSRLHPTIWVHQQAMQYTHQGDAPAAACRPFDAKRDGMVNGEGAAAFVLERRDVAEARGAKILARVLGFASAFEPARKGQTLSGAAIRQVIRGAMTAAGISARDVGHVNAHGMSTTLDDRIEAQAIHDTLGAVPVTAPKSYFGNLAAGSGAVEMAVSVLGLQHGLIPPTLNYQTPDPDCPVNVIREEPLSRPAPVALVLNHACTGQATAVVLALP